MVKEGQIVVGNTMKVTLACDHRTVDGATGALILTNCKSLHRKSCDHVSIEFLKLYMKKPLEFLEVFFIKLEE